MQNKMGVDRVILLGMNDSFSRNATKKMSLILGGLLLFQAGFYLFKSDLDFYLVMGLMTIPIALLHVYLGTVGLSASSRFSPKVSINEDQLLIKTNLFRKGMVANWSSIRSIDFKSYQIGLQMQEGLQIVNYTTDADTSKEIKKAIQEMAEAKGIPINGG